MPPADWQPSPTTGDIPRELQPVRRQHGCDRASVALRRAGSANKKWRLGSSRQAASDHPPPVTATATTDQHHLSTSRLDESLKRCSITAMVRRYQQITPRGPGTDEPAERVPLKVTGQ